MDRNKLNEFKMFFLEKKKKTQLLCETKEHQDLLDSNGGDEMDVAQNITIEDMSNKLIQRHKTMLVRINAALNKIEQGNFGECEECGEEIFEARLKAIPDCQLCIYCAEQEEKNRKQYR